MEQKNFEKKRVCQIGIIVKDLEKTGARLADFLEVAVPPAVGSGDHEVVQAEYLGKPSTASCQMMFFDLDNIQLELIQPDEQPSVWRDFLETKGEGIHHLAFQVKDTQAQLDQLEEKGMKLLQKGNYGNASGMYAYVDTTEALSFFIETLEDF